MRARNPIMTHGQKVAAAVGVAEWMRDAACAVDGVDRDLFYDDKAKTGTPHESFAICSRCPVKAA